jgi:tRNA(adenine34) deaminase
MTDSELMQHAIAEARRAESLGEVPIGCVVFHRGSSRIIGLGHNLRIAGPDPTAHAEIVAIRQAARAVGDWRLVDCTLAVTLEPCAMCAGAIVNARIDRLVYGCDDPKAGAVRSLYQLCTDARLNHRLDVVAGVESEACSRLLSDFFRARRAEGKK